MRFPFVSFLSIFYICSILPIFFLFRQSVSKTSLSRAHEFCDPRRYPSCATCRSMRLICMRCGLEIYMQAIDRWWYVIGIICCTIWTLKHVLRVVFPEVLLACPCRVLAASMRIVHSFAVMKKLNIKTTYGQLCDFVIGSPYQKRVHRLLSCVVHLITSISQSISIIRRVTPTSSLDYTGSQKIFEG